MPRPPPAAAPAPAPLVALALEIRRSGLLQSLRGQFVAACHAQGIASPPMHAFERWRFLGKWEEEAALGASAAEPLLPAQAVAEAEAAAAAAEAAAAEAEVEAAAEVEAEAGEVAEAAAAIGACSASAPRTARQWLCHDLRRAGMAEAVAARTAARLLCSSAEAAAQLAALRAELERRGGPRGLAVHAAEQPDGSVRLWATEGRRGGEEEGGEEAVGGAEMEAGEGAAAAVTLAAHALERLRQLHTRHAARGGGSGSGTAATGGARGAAAGKARGAAAGEARGAAEGLCGEALLRTRALTLALRYRSIGG